jgi:diguanylate cyclase (GGDEF)-like protein
MKKLSNIHIEVVFISLALYILLFLLIYPFAGPASAALAIAPISIAGWFLGVRGSLSFGILSAPLNLFLFRMAGDMISANNPAAAIFASIIFTAVGTTAAWIRGLLNRLHEQADELQEERQILQEEMEKRIQAEERLIHEALHDPLTGLPNRRLFADRLEHAIERNKRKPDSLNAVVYLDFDRFKIINDSLGHNVGDQLLVKLGQCLKSTVRTMDTVARMGGDEFAILLESIQKKDEIITIVKRIQESLTIPFQIQGNSIAMTASFGIVVDLIPYKQIDDILRDADIAMYSAKVSGKNNFKVFDIAMREQVLVASKLEDELRHAVRNGEFRIHYQPIYSLKTKRITGFEALLRWEHPERGLLYPADLLKTAEESGLIVPIGQWVLYEACRQMKQWQSQFRMEPPLTISVNLSSRQFAQPDLVRQIKEVLDKTNLPASSLFLELAEITLIEDIEKAVTKIKQIRALGVGIEIDDFGTGYSSLGYLRHLPVNILKLDRSFTSTLGISKSAIPIIRAIIAMANSLDMDIIAEGIETVDQMNNLIELECGFGQGFFFNKAVDSYAAEVMISESVSKQR